jgi:hypothetical protein
VKDSGIATTSAALLVTAACTGAVGTGNGTTYPLVPYATQGGTSCSQTGSTQEMPIPATCTGKSLYVTASAAGATVGSGVVTVYYDGNIPSSGPACTLGISTTCNDLTHTVAMSAGHTYSVRVKTGQASDTTANVRASFICQ